MKVNDRRRELEEKRNNMSIQEILQHEKLLSRKPESYWDELIHIEKLKKQKPEKFQDVPRKDPAGNILASNKNQKENMNSNLSTPDRELSPEPSLMHQDSYSTERQNKRGPRNRLSPIKKTAMVIAAKKELLDSEYFFDNKPSLKMKNKSSVSFEKQTGRVYKHQMYNEVNGTYDLLFP